MIRTLCLTAFLSMVCTQLWAEASNWQGMAQPPAAAAETQDSADAEFGLPAFKGRGGRLMDSRLLAGQLVDDSGPGTDEQMFGAGVSLGFAGNPFGLGVGGWFDFYVTPWLAVAIRSSLAFGTITRDHQLGGTASEFGISAGAKFVFDFPDWEWARWCRPFAAVYPLGFRAVSGEEDYRVPAGRTGAGSRETIRYSDVFYVFTWGGGVDFFLTSNIGVGVGLYFDGTVGGSRHRRDGITVRTRGETDFFFEYARLAFRF